MKGFTIIELMIVVAIVGILAAVAIPLFSGNSPSGPSSFTHGLNGVTETRCVNGYQFVVGSNGTPQQVIGVNGGGVQCQ